MAGLEGLNPEFARRLLAMQAAARAAGTDIGWGSGLRSVDEQIALRKKNGCPDVWNAPASSCRVPTAIPGRSQHNHGFAMDITGDKAWANAHAAEFGLAFNVSGEDWHVEMAGEGAHQMSQQAGADSVAFDLNWASKPGDLQESQDSLIKSYMDVMTTAHQDALLSTPMPAEVATPEIGEVSTPVEAPAPVRQDTMAVPGEGAPAGGSPASGDRLGNARIIADVGRRMGANDQQIRIALAAALVESNLVNVNYGDRDSLGLFQQRPSQGWGSPSQVMDPHYAAAKFFSGLLKLDPSKYGSPGLMAQAVQRSAYPGRYDERWGEASSIFNQLGGG